MKPSKRKVSAVPDMDALIQYTANEIRAKQLRERFTRRANAKR